MKKKRAYRVRKLAQNQVTWYCSVRKAPTWITPDDRPPFRPYIVLVMDVDNDRVRQSMIMEENPTDGEVLAVLLKAMHRPMPGSGRRGRPAVIMLDDRELVEKLLAPLAEHSVRCEYRASMLLLDKALRKMCAFISGPDHIPSLTGVPGVTIPLLEELYQAAYSFHQAAPWRWLPDDYPIEVECGDRKWYAVVMGNAGISFGLAGYQSLDDLDLLYSGLDENVEETKTSGISLTFDEPMFSSFDDLDAIDKYGWPVAGETAYPCVVKYIPPGDLVPLNVAEITNLATGLQVVPNFVTHHMQANKGEPRPAEATYSLSGVLGNSTIKLRYPVRW